jgi:CO dehydrogenase/acetyl-CoA synthase epsilon subunit
MIQRTLSAIKPGAAFVLNIGSRKYPLNQVLFDNFSKNHKITKMRNYLSNAVGALGKKGEGETFYQIIK